MKRKAISILLAAALLFNASAVSLAVPGQSASGHSDSAVVVDSGGSGGGSGGGKGSGSMSAVSDSLPEGLAHELEAYINACKQYILEKHKILVL